MGLGLSEIYAAEKGYSVPPVWVESANAKVSLVLPLDIRGVTSGPSVANEGAPGFA